MAAPAVRLAATQPPLPAAEDVHNCPGSGAGHHLRLHSLLLLQLEVCREQAQWAQAEKRTFLRQRIDSRLANLYLETRDYQAAIALITKLLSEVRPDLLGEMLTVAPCSTLGAHRKDAQPGPHLHRSARKDADRGISSVGTALLRHTAAH